MTTNPTAVAAEVAPSVEDVVRLEWKSLGPILRPVVYVRDNFKCVYCGDGIDLTIDHRTPISRGGNNCLWNLATCCRPCNSLKDSMTEEEWVNQLNWLRRLDRLAAPPGVG